MTTTDRPFYTFKNRMIDLIEAADQANVEEVLINKGDWLRLKEAAGKAGQLVQSDKGVTSLLIEGVRFTQKKNSKPPSGRLDLSDPENPSIEP